jgi:hypothetical protein
MRFTQFRDFCSSCSRSHLGYSTRSSDQVHSFTETVRVCKTWLYVGLRSVMQLVGIAYVTYYCWFIAPKTFRCDRNLENKLAIGWSHHEGWITRFYSSWRKCVWRCVTFHPANAWLTLMAYFSRVSCKPISTLAKRWLPYIGPIDSFYRQVLKLYIRQLMASCKLTKKMSILG